MWLFKLLEQMAPFVEVIFIVLFVLFLLIAGLRYVVAGGSARRVEATRSSITTTIQGAVISLLSFVLWKIILYVVTLLVAGSAVTFSFIAVNAILNRFGIFVNNEAATIGGIATAIYTILNYWLILETRRARRAQEKAIKMQEAVIKAQEAAAQSDKEAQNRIVVSLEIIAQALHEQQEKTRQRTQSTIGVEHTNIGANHDDTLLAKLGTILQKRNHRSET